MSSIPITLACLACGKSFTAPPSQVRRGRRFCSKSCGARQPHTHGAASTGRQTTEYRIWANFRSRCQNPDNARYADYGGRGITVCPGWNTFPQFLADMGSRPDGGELDRIDNDGGYWCGRCEACRTAGQPANCRWATRAEQMNNTRRNMRLTFQGRTQTLRAWACELGMDGKTLWQRIVKRRWPVARALTEPVRKSRSR